MRILVVGAGGYVGGRLVPRLLEQGHSLTLASRQPATVGHRFPGARILPNDPRDHGSLTRALADAGAPPDVIYVIPESIPRHSSNAWRDELQVASDVGRAASVAGSRRIVHLGELGDAPPTAPSSRPGSLSDRGLELAREGVPTCELRSSLVIGSGSATFEIVRHLANRIPIMTMPGWVKLPAQPIAIRDVLVYLVAALDSEVTGVVEIGGPETLTFAEMLSRYESSQGFRRVKISLPIATAWASDAWIGLVSPLPRGVAGAIIERLQHGCTVRDPAPARSFGVDCLTYDEAVERAVERVHGNRVESTWFDAFESRRRPAPMTFAAAVGGRRMLTDRRVREIAAPAEHVFDEVQRLGGPRGWPSANLLWRIRGWIDRLVGGLGMRLGRRDLERLRVGDALDFWRVEAIDAPRLIRLRAEMRVPGRAWLEFSVEPTPTGSRLVQTAYFDPEGLAGYAYWYLLLPVHLPVFVRMADVLRRRAAAAGPVDRK